MTSSEEFFLEKDEPEVSLVDRLHNFLVKYLPWWPLFACLIVMAILSAWLYLRYTTPIYQIKASVLIKDDKSGMDQSKLLESLNIFGEKKNVENEIQVIRSRTLATEVATELRLYAPVMSEGSVVDASAFITSPIVIDLRNPDTVKEVSKVFFSYDTTQNMVKMGDQRYPLNEWDKTPYGELRFIKNPYYNNVVVDRPLYFSLLSAEDAGLGLLKNLDVAPVSKLSSVVSFSYKDAIPVRGKSVLNAWIAAYNNAAIADKNQLAANTLKFVEERLRYVVHELDSVEQDLERFRTRNKVVDLSTQGQLFLTNVSATDSKITEMEMQRSILGRVENYVSGKSSADSAIVPATLGITDPVLLQSLQGLYDLESQRVKMARVTGENSPLMLSLREQIAAVKPTILENIRNQRLSLDAGIRTLTQSNNRYASVLQGMPQKERELLNISRQQAIKNNIFTFLLQKREETALSYSSTVADSRIIDSAIADKVPFSPRRMMIWLAALGIAVAIGIATVEIQDLLNRNITQRSEIEKYTSVPILGEIGQEDTSQSSIVIGQGRRSLVAEQVRQLRTTLGYLGINSRKKRILVTSTVPGEGKSFVCANLGISLALTGKKVVLIELDIRKPKLSSIFNTSREIGITQFFIGEKEFQQIIKPVPDQSNLFLIPSGPIPPNPSELIMNGKLAELLNELDKQFDYILIDTSPVSPVTDAHIISPLCDATLYVVRQKVTPKFYIKKLDENLKVKPLKNVAIVLNGVKTDGFGRYGYGYGYGYGYLEEQKPKKKKIKV